MSVGWGRGAWGSDVWGGISVSVSVTGLSATSALGNETVVAKAIVAVTGLAGTCYISTWK